MVASLYRENKTFFNVEDDTWTTLALWTILCYQGLLDTVNRLINFILNKEVIWDTAILGGVASIFIILGTVSAIKKSNRREWVLIGILVILWTLNFFINDKSRMVFQMYYFKPVMIDGVCGIICIANYSNWEKFKKIGSWFVIPGSVLFFIVTILNISGDIDVGYMATSYNVLPIVVGVFWLAINRKNIILWFFAIVGTIAILLTGCRGAFVCICVYFTLEIIFNKKIKWFMKVVFLIAIVLLVGNLNNIMTGLDSYLKAYDYESRTIGKFIEGTIEDDSGRSTIKQEALEVINEHLIFGCGMGGSSYYLFEKMMGITPTGMQHTYAHNLFLDLWMDFGVFMGSGISILLFLGIIIAYVKKRKFGELGILFFFVSIIIPKLLLSSNYLKESSFFLLIGLLFNFVFNPTEKLDKE